MATGSPGATDWGQAYTHGSLSDDDVIAGSYLPGPA
jgi:hypothetical protein